MADLRREPVRPSEQPAISDDAASDARSHRHEQHVPISPARAEPVLAVRRHVRVVVQLTRDAECLLHPLGDRQVAPSEVRREPQDASFGVHHACSPHPHREDVRRDEAACGGDHRGDGSLLVVGGRRDLSAGEDLAVASHAEGVDLGAADVDAERFALIGHLAPR